MSTIDTRSVARWQKRYRGAAFKPRGVSFGHPTKKHTEGRMRHFEDDGGRGAKAKMRYENLLARLFRAARIFFVGKKSVNLFQYGGASLRKIRAKNGVGRPPNRVRA